MKRFYFRKDRAIREAFQIYDSAKVRTAEDKGSGGASGQSEGAGEREKYLEDFEESRVQEGIIRLIEKMPIKNPRRKVRRIWLSFVAVLLLAVLAGCMTQYIREKPVRITRALQEVYKESGARRQKGAVSLVTEDGLCYQCHRLSAGEQERLYRRGVTYERAEHENVSDQSVKLQIYNIAGRKSRQFILARGENDQIFLGRFIAYSYQQSSGGTEKKAERSVEDLFGVDKMAECSARDLLEVVMDIHSSEDIRSVTLEHAKPINKDDPEKLAAMWTGQEEKRWFYEFFSEEKKILPLSALDSEDQEIVCLMREEGMPVTHDKKLFHWKSQVLKEIPERAFYLGIENKYREMFLLGLILDGQKAELRIEPSEGSGDVLCLSADSQRELSDALRKVLDE